MTRTPTSLSIVFRVKRSGWSSARHGDGAAEASASNATMKRRAPARRPVRSDGKEDAPCDPDRVGAAQRPASSVTHAWGQLKAKRVGAARVLPQSKSCRLKEKGGRAMQIVRYLALGDSYTIGEGVEPSERWPAQLASLLRQEGLAALEAEI